MGRIIKKRAKQDRHLSYMAVQPDRTDRFAGHEVYLVGGARAYLWFRSGASGGVGWLHGRATLRALAHAILEAYPDEPKRGKR